jgi:hypothetical protein
MEQNEGVEVYDDPERGVEISEGGNTIYLLNNKRHRYYGPAVIKHNGIEDGVEYWYENGKFHSVKIR